MSFNYIKWQILKALDHVSEVLSEKNSHVFDIVIWSCEN